MTEAVVRVVMMQRDEGALLMAWLSHYSGLFGMERLTIFDNGSTDPLTLHLLARAETCGATVRRDFTDPADFHAKGLHFVNEMRRWDAGPDYDFALPVDCDEFLAVVCDETISPRRADVHQEFARLVGERRALRIGTSLFNVVDRPGWFAVDTDFIKGFVPAGGVDAMDNGQHNPSSSLAAGYALTRFTYLHWHNHPFAEMRARARRKLANSLVDPDNPAGLERYAATPNLPGQHLVPVLLNDEAHYLRRYDGCLRVFLPWARSVSGAMAAFSEDALLMEDPSGRLVWNAERYLSCNPDVTGWAPGPLVHFLIHGWREKRMLAAVS